MQDRQLTLTRIMQASPAKLWRCWTDAALLPLWFGPDGYSCQTIEIDLREGGQWRFDMIAPDGTVFPNRHRYTAHEPPGRIEFLMDSGNDADAPAPPDLLTPGTAIAAPSTASASALSSSDSGI